MLLEIILEFFFEGLADASGDPKVPKAIRYMLFSFICAIPITIGVLCCFSSYEATGFMGMVILAIITLFLIALWVFGMIKIWRGK